MFDLKKKILVASLLDIVEQRLIFTGYFGFEAEIEFLLFM